MLDVLEIHNDKEANGIFKSIIEAKELTNFPSLDKYIKENPLTYISYNFNNADDMNIDIENGTLAEYIIDNYEKFNFTIKYFLQAKWI